MQKIILIKKTRKKDIKMKKLLVLMLCILALGASGCGKKQEEAQPTQAPQPTPIAGTIENGAIGAVEENGKVKINMPAVIFGDDVEGTANNTKERRGFESAVVEADGSVTFTMTKEQQEQWVLETFENSKQYANELVSGFISLKEAELSEDFKTATIKADKDAYKSETDKVSADGVANLLFNCQSMSGVKKEDLKVTVKFVDFESGEVIETVEVLANN